ncbi:MAG: preprotein translocase subunit SecE [Gammaproteobacteria bacterium]
MNSKVEAQGSKADVAKLTVALVLLVGGAVAFNYYAQEPLVLRVLAILVVAGVALAIVMQTALGRRSWGFVKDSRTEVRKVVWPTRKETTQTTLVVIVMVIILGFLLWIMDSFLLWAVKLLTGQGA